MHESPSPENISTKSYFRQAKIDAKLLLLLNWVSGFCQDTRGSRPQRNGHSRGDAEAARGDDSLGREGGEATRGSHGGAQEEDGGTQRGNGGKESRSQE